MSHAPKTAAADSFHEIVTLRIELEGIEPPIWREVEVPTSLTLKALHDVIQIVMGWFDIHLWEFVFGSTCYGLPADADWGTAPRREAAKTRLRDVLRRGVREGRYIYDFGDDWQHRLHFSAIRQGDPALGYPRYLGGERNGPPEDCGGLPGFEETMAILADPNHPDHAEIADRLEDYDPDEIDVLPIHYALSRIANRRNAVRARLAKG